MIRNNKSTMLVEEQAFDGDLYVADYLREAPDFFTRNPDLLLELEVPHRERGAVSLVERRLTLHREQYSNLQQRLSEIVDVAQQNDHLSELLHDYSVGLMAADSLEAVFEYTKTILAKRLRCEMTNAVILKTDDMNEEHFSDYVSFGDAKQCASMSDLHARKSVYCGYPISNRVDQFFPNQSDTIKSIAIIRLGKADLPNIVTMKAIDAGVNQETRPADKATAFGYLALASADRSRFAPHMGTDFLSRFGSLLSARMAAFY